MHLYYVVLGVLCVWRITHLLQAEDGPGGIFVRLRRAAGQGFWGDLLDCFYCLSLWVSAPFAALLGQRWLERAMLWLALSAAAILLERITDKRPGLGQAAWFEQPPEHASSLTGKQVPQNEESVKEDSTNVLLRQTETEFPNRADQRHSTRFTQ
jgi:Protein of unknown function (DUF1360)